MRVPTLLELNTPGHTLMYVRLGVGGAWAQAILSAVPGWYNERGVRLVDVYTTPALRGQGFSRRACQIALDYADEKKWPVFLYVNPYGRSKNKMDAEQLVNFYLKLGFRVIKHEAAQPVMLRA